MYMNMAQSSFIFMSDIQNRCSRHQYDECIVNFILKLMDDSPYGLYSIYQSTTRKSLNPGVFLILSLGFVKQAKTANVVMVTTPQHTNGDIIVQKKFHINALFHEGPFSKYFTAINRCYSEFLPTIQLRYMCIIISISKITTKLHGYVYKVHLNDYHNDRPQRLMEIGETNPDKALQFQVAI